MVYLEVIKLQRPSLASNLKYLNKSVLQGIVHLLFVFLPLCFSILSSSHSDFYCPATPLDSPTPSCRSFTLYFLPLPVSAWLRCEIILLLGGFPAICHCHLLALRLEGGSLFQKHTALRFTTLSIINSWARDWRGVYQRSSAFYWAWLGNTKTGERERERAKAAKEGWKIYN